MVPTVASCFFLLSTLLLSIGVAGQPWIQSITIESVDDSQLVLQPGESRNVTCKIRLVQTTENPSIEFYKTNYRRIMEEMEVEEPYSCEDESTIKQCYRVAVISSSLSDQNIQCAFHVSGNVFYSQTFTVLVENGEKSSSIPTPSPTKLSSCLPACHCPTPTTTCEGSTSGSVNGSVAQFLALLLISFMAFHLL